MAHVSPFAGAIGATLDPRSPSDWLAAGDLLDLLPDGGIDTSGLDDGDTALRGDARGEAA